MLHHIGAAGGVAAVAGAMQSMGWFGAAHAATLEPMPGNLGNGRSVIVLGAGFAGLVAAYELEQRGFSVTLLEARGRVGGKAWTVRDGDTIKMQGEADQVARFSEGLYFNAGPARLPSFHQGVLGYAKRFGVPLEVEVNSSRSAYLVGKNGRKLRMRTAINDMRGHVSELLAKAVNQGALDQALSVDEKAQLLPFLKAYGDLEGEYEFKGTTRSGLRTSPGAGVSSFETAGAPVPLSELLANEQIAMMGFEDNLYMQATMFQPVGGMDQISVGIERNLQQRAVLNADVRRIRQSASGVDIAYIDTGTGTARTLKADYCVCTIPFPVLAGIDANFSKPVASAIAGVVYEDSNKVAFEAPRFWEQDQIYGGLTFVGGETSLIWYPSWGLHGERGMILGCYSSGPPGKAFAQRPLTEQIAMARAAIESVHPGHGDECSAPLVVNWRKVPYSLGPWPNWTPGARGRGEHAATDTPAFRLLNQPDGRIVFASAALSQTPGWQEGALASAHASVAAIVRQMAERSVTERSPRAAAA
ncbi:FAD-dependent oxidoreductase [Blastomonas sp. AAP53]|uniref:flavin monoamine oxidase family protein n=1 Tax=Blastomonas sp. AAP53 TaxID=1248760 RepID=UPI0002DCB995|nr:FAD-dependent oxidoreductase [Blastomonas sp. AAP53]